MFSTSANALRYPVVLLQGAKFTYPFPFITYPKEILIDQNNQLMREIMPATDRIITGTGGLVCSSILRE